MADNTPISQMTDEDLDKIRADLHDARRRVVVLELENAQLRLFVDGINQAVTDA